ncbi:MAG: ECF-type sigma factor [Planctomycetota bacterium]|jgi:RNA polymerase sigma factor (TIGR02999 family)
MGQVTRILAAVKQDDRQAADELLPIVYEELRKLAQSRLQREVHGHTLQPTALVHEAFLRLVGNEDPGWDGRNHFFAAAARAMRQILVERARHKQAVKHGGARQRIPIDQIDLEFEAVPEEVLAVDEAIERLERVDPRKGQIVNLRFFARMTVAETAAVLDISIATVGREWQYIRTWLEAELARDQPL